MTSLAQRFKDPAHLLAHLGIRRHEEIAVEAIAEYLGATVVFDELRGAEASVVGRGDRAIITVNRASPRERQRLAAAHELAHWVLDRGASGFVPPTPWGVEEVEWWDEEGEDELVSPEHRAEEWASELLLPELMLSRDLPWDAPLTLDTVRDLGRLYRTPLLTTALRVLVVTHENAALIRSRRGEPSRCLRRTHGLFDATFHESGPLPGTVAHGLLHGSGDAPGPTEMGSEAWLSFNQGWWTTVTEDSVVMADGEVLSLLWWPGEVIARILDFWPEEALPPEPGEEAVRRLVRTMGTEWKYGLVEWAGEDLVLETREPSVQRVVIPKDGSLDAAGLRGLVAEVARQKGVEVSEVLHAMIDSV